MDLFSDQTPDTRPRQHASTYHNPCCACQNGAAEPCFMNHPLAPTLRRSDFLPLSRSLSPLSPPSPHHRYPAPSPLLSVPCLPERRAGRTFPQPSTFRSASPACLSNNKNQSRRTPLSFSLGSIFHVQGTPTIDPLALSYFMSAIEYACQPA